MGSEFVIEEATEIFDLELQFMLIGAAKKATRLAAIDKGLSRTYILKVAEVLNREAKEIFTQFGE